MLAALLGFLGGPVASIIDKAVPDKDQAAKIKHDLQMAAMSNEAEMQKAVLELAKEDAKSGKGGFRHGAGWLCIYALGYAWLAHPLLSWAMLLVAPDVKGPPSIPAEAQYAMLTGMLGLGGIRAYDLKNGTRN